MGASLAAALSASGTIPNIPTTADDDEKRTTTTSLLLHHLKAEDSNLEGIPPINGNGVERTAIITMTNSANHQEDITMNIQIQSTGNRKAKEAKKKKGKGAGKRVKKGKSTRGRRKG